MFQVRTTNPLFSSKQYFYVKDDAVDYIKTVIKVSLNFFRQMNKEERSKYEYGKLEKMHKHISLTYFNHHNKNIRKCFGKAVKMQPPITYEEFMEKWQKENKKRHNAIGSSKEKVSRSK